MPLSEIQEALPMLLQLLFLVACGALLVGFFLGIINFIVKNSIAIVLIMFLFFAWQSGVLLEWFRSSTG